ncbi:hypothetical protein FSP39_020514 [Pinctada imbricata]|uniref:YLP motif-containing protein 1 n=1 Tax=Pinctada imbricata TaxID=66713 RepID=A0AA88XXN4_PINIB|nr:hypothetical protein FSP39_020514 [Pinctada imbricata]
MFGRGQNQMYGSVPRFGPRGGHMGNQRPHFGMRGPPNQGQRFGFPGNQHGNRFQNSNRMQSPYGMQEGNNESEQSHKDTNLQQSWLQKHLQGPHNVPKHPLPGSKGGMGNQQEKPIQTGAGEQPTSVAGQPLPTQPNWSKDEAGDGSTEGKTSQETIKEEIKSLQKQQEMLNELKKFEKAPQNKDTKDESKPSGPTTQSKEGQEKSQDKSQSQSPMKKDETASQQGQKTATPSKEGGKSATPTSQSAGNQQKSPTIDQGVRAPTPNQQGARAPTPSQPGARLPTPGQGNRPPTPGQQGTRPQGPNQFGQRPPGPTKPEQRPTAPNQPGQRPPGPNQQGQRPSGPNQQGQRPPVPNQQGLRPPGPNQPGQRAPGPNQQGQRPPAPNQAGQRPTGLNQTGQRPPGPNEQGPRGPRQLGQRPQGPNQFGQRLAGPSQTGPRFQAPNQRGQRFPGPNQQGSRTQNPNQFGQRPFGRGQGPRGSRPSLEEQGYDESEYYQDQEQEDQGPQDWNWQKDAGYEESEWQHWGNRGARGGRGRGRGNDRGRGRGGWQGFHDEGNHKGYQEEESQQEDYIHDDNPYLQEEEEEESKGMEEEGEAYMDALKESNQGTERDYGRGPADYRRDDPYRGEPRDQGYDRFGRRSPPPHDPYSRVPPHDPYGRAPPPDPYYDRRDPYDRYDPYRRPDPYARDPYEYDRRPYYDPYRPPAYDYGREYRYGERYPPPEDKPYQKPEVIDHGHKSTEFSSARESPAPYVAPQTVIDYGHGKQEEREVERPPSSLDRDRERSCLDVRERIRYNLLFTLIRFRDLPLSYGSPGRDGRSRQVVHEARIETVKVDDLLIPPGRKSRPSQIVVILRGPPGAGKTYVGKLIKDKEVQHGGGAPRMLCLDDYFMVEQEKTERDPETGKKVKKKVLEYEYEPEMESSYRQNMFKSFKKTVDDGFFPFIIVDAVNDRVKHFEEFWSYAKSKGFQVYVAEIDAEPAVCSKRNTHKRSLREIEKIKDKWEETPRHYLRLDIRALLQEDSITEVEMEDEVEKSSEKRKKDESDDDEDLDENRFGGVYKKSKWEVEGSEKSLDKLDGLVHHKRKRTPSPTSIDDFLRDEMSRPLLPGQKRVRWADLEERKMQYRMREIGFVVGQTQRDWERITDDSFADRQLNRTKYI